jgi:hypothetical protein
MADIAYDSLSARVDVHMLDCYVLLTLAPFPRGRCSLLTIAFRRRYLRLGAGGFFGGR